MLYSPPRGQPAILPICLWARQSARPFELPSRGLLLNYGPANDTDVSRCCHLEEFASRALVVDSRLEIMAAGLFVIRAFTPRRWARWIQATSSTVHTTTG